VDAIWRRLTHWPGSPSTYCRRAGSVDSSAPPRRYTDETNPTLADLAGRGRLARRAQRELDQTADGSTRRAAPMHRVRVRERRTRAWLGCVRDSGPERPRGSADHRRLLPALRCSRVWSQTGSRRLVRLRVAASAVSRASNRAAGHRNSTGGRQRGHAARRQTTACPQFRCRTPAARPRPVASGARA
jgi:hypothetical protein